MVGTAANGKVALAQTRRTQPDLLRLDLEMPVMDGLETLARCEDYPRLPVIMFPTLTVARRGGDARRAELGADDYVPKPANVGSVKESWRRSRTS